MRIFDQGLLTSLSDGTQEAVDAFLAWLIPPSATGIRPEFWNTPEGDALAQAQWGLYHHEALSLADALRLLGKTATATNIMYLEEHISVYRRPGRTLLRRMYYVRQSEVEALRGE